MKKIKKYHSKVLLFFAIGIMTGIVVLIALARLTWHTKFYPGVKIASIPVQGLTREQTKVMLDEKVKRHTVKLVFNGSTWETAPGAMNTEIEATLNEAYRYGRRLQPSDYLLLLTARQMDYPLVIAPGRTEKLDQLIQEISNAVEIAPIEPSIEIVDHKLRISNGSDGTIISSEKLDQDIRKNFSELSEGPIEIPTTTARRAMNAVEMETLRVRAESLLGDNLTLTLDDEKIKLSDKELLSFLSTDLSGEIVNKRAISEYVSGLAESLNKDPQDARFEFSEGKVKEFAPGKDGVRVNIQSTTANIQIIIDKLLNENNKNETVEIVAEKTAPKVTTEKVNELGIKERIGRGESYYQHSIPNRIYNVALASSRINSALIGPGEEVSFNKLVGEVSGATGYRQAYIISGGRTVLGDGGGLCQVSTTMFRAAMAAGLPILERWGHAYRVSYYELNSKPGVDATVIAPSKDFRFKNDTPGHILIQTINDPKKLLLVIEIYGTSDGRVASVSEPKVWGISPPLPTIYQDDPTLPTGIVKQVDWAASGAKASFEYKVVRDGETLQEKTFSTTYRPWASVFMRGTGQ
ncbi:MAG: VanW family protein [Microgenomates group bacterium]